MGEEKLQTIPSEEVAKSTVDAQEQTGDRNAKRKKMAFIIAGVVLAAVAAVVLLFATHVICFHEWNPATCSNPEMCAVCGRTQGEALGHDYQEATCVDPKMCVRCSEVFGSPLGHDVRAWESGAEATCSQVGERHGICSRCDKSISEEVPKLAHTDGEWVITKDVIINTDGTIIPGTKGLMCAVCGQEMKSETYTIELTLSQKNALKKESDMLTWMYPSYEYSIYWLTTFEGFSEEDAVFAADHCGADWNEQAALCAKQQMDLMGASRDGLVQHLRMYKFNNEQIEYALAAVGY